MARRRLGEVLRDRGLLTAEEVDVWLARQAGDVQGRRLGQLLVDAGKLSPEQVGMALAGVHGLAFVDLRSEPVDPEAARLLPRIVADRACAVPIAWKGQHLLVAVSDPVDIVTLDDIRMLTGASGLDVVVAAPAQVRDVVDRVWADQVDREVVTLLEEEAESEAQALPDEDINSGATVRMIDRLISHAARSRASDLHLEPQREGLRVRERVDGVMRDVITLPSASQAALLARVKVMCGLDMMERRLPQDGRMRVSVDGHTMDVRVSTLPSLRGDTIVLRLLPTAHDLPSLAELGLALDQQRELADSVRSHQGLVLITGPTGSGKTNTLYAAIRELIDVDRNVITLEDPVEVEIPGATQVQIDEKMGLTFARGLRSALRQDPDVILVGEIRDTETAELAVRAALTGHLVLATLHTLDAASTVTRLVDMGVAPYLVASSLSLVVAQRLLRRPCPDCQRRTPLDDQSAAVLGLPEGTVVPEGVGCPACEMLGHHGRVGVFETLRSGPEVRRALLDLGDEDSVRHAAGDPMTLAERAGAAAAAGRTTGSEALRLIGHHADGAG